jgi:hypothetical protein
MQDRCAVCVERTIGSKIVLDDQVELLGEWVMWNLISVRLELVLVSVQYRWTICAGTYNRLINRFVRTQR